MLRRAKKTSSKFLCSAVIAIGMGAGAAQADRLADALVGAYSHSGLLDQNRALLRAADEDVAIAASQLKPIVNWSANLTRQLGTQKSSQAVSTGFFTTEQQTVRQSLAQTTITAQLSATLQLFDGGADATRVAAQEELVLATRAALRGVEQLVLLRAATAYFNVLRQQEFVALSQNNLRLLKREERAAQDRFDLGEVTRTDVALAQSAVAQARSNLASAERNLKQAQGEYAAAVGHPPGRLSALPRLPRVETQIANAQSVAVRAHPDMAQAQHQVAAQDLLVRAAGLDMSPTINLQGTLSVTEQFGAVTATDRATVGVNVTGPIYNGGRLYAAERRAFANSNAARGNLHNTRHQVQQDVIIALSNLEAARASLSASERQIRAARIAFDGVREEAKVGQRTTLDVLDAEQDLLDAETNRISAQADQYIAAYGVLESMGLLTAEQLKLPVQQYDPKEYYNLVKDAPARVSRQGRQLDRVLRALSVDQ